MSSSNGTGPGLTTTEITMDCSSCKKSFRLDLPKVEVINNPRISMSVAPHEKLSKCPHCGASYMFLISSVQTSWSISPISEEQRRQIEGTNVISLLK